MTTQRLLIAGIGNIFLSDDGFGCEVARRLAGTDVPATARVTDYGIRGMHLAYDLTSGGYDRAILVDAMTRGGAPGSVYVVEADTDRVPGSMLDAHGMQPDVVLSMLDALGGFAGQIVLVGCEPASADYGIGLSAPVAAAVDRTVQVVLDLATNGVAKEWAYVPWDSR